MASKRIIKRTPTAAPPDEEPELDEDGIYEPPDPPKMAGNGASYEDEDEGEGGDPLIRGGWGASQETIDSTSSYAQTFRPSKDLQVIRFMEGKPYASFRRHWIDRVGLGKRAYTCFSAIGKDCPLCMVGDKPTAVTAFNVALCTRPGGAVIKSWECGVKITQQLKTYSNDPKIGPLDKPGMYYTVAKSETQARQQSVTMVNPVRGRDLLEGPERAALTGAWVTILEELLRGQDRGHPHTSGHGGGRRRDRG